MMTRSITALGVLVLGLGVLTACSEKKSEVSFNKDIMPIFEKNCLECHAQGSEGETKSGLGLYSYAALMKGTKFGPVVVPGSSLNSVLNQVVEGRTDKSIHMPHGKAHIYDEDIAKLKAWVDEGAKDN